jgi:hypothetical protein
MSASPRLPTSSSVSSTNRTSSILRGGGRLYTSPPLDGYTEQEMVAEAQVRWRPPAYRWRRRGPDIYLPPFVHLTMCTRMFVSILGPALLSSSMQVRLKHNVQLRRMKQLLDASSEDGRSVATRDLLMAAKLAKLVRSPHP